MNSAYWWLRTAPGPQSESYYLGMYVVGSGPSGPWCEWAVREYLYGSEVGADFDTPFGRLVG